MVLDGEEGLECESDVDRPCDLSKCQSPNMMNAECRRKAASVVSKLQAPSGPFLKLGFCTLSV